LAVTSIKYPASSGEKPVSGIQHPVASDAGAIAPQTTTVANTKQKEAMTMADSDGPKVKLERVNQLGIVVRDCEKVADYWEKMFGIGPWTFTTNPRTDSQGNPLEVKLGFAYMGDLELELIEIVKGKTIHSEFLDEHGEGLHHLGCFVDDVDRAATDMAEEGIEVMMHRPGQFVYLDTRSPGGVIFEPQRRRGKVTGG